jgi:adenylate cyclase
MSPTNANLAILFADVSGSTRLYETLGDAEARAIVERCLAIVADVCKEQGGQVIKTIGDEMMTTYATADHAARAACDVQTRIAALRTESGTAVSMHLGFHYGPVIANAGDVYGDAVNIAARMTELASGGQIITTAQTVAELSVPLRAGTRDLDSLTVKGKQKDVAIYELLWQETADELTALSPRRVARPQRVRLVHGNRMIELGESTGIFALGRDAANDLVIADRMASRMHARIERRRDNFVLVDHSSNGTYVRVEGEAEMMLRREEWRLRGHGYCSFGHPHEQDPTEVLEFQCFE